MPRSQRPRRKQQDASEHGYRVIYEGLSEGGYQVIVPALPGIVTYGRTLTEAREMARDAIACHLLGLLRNTSLPASQKQVEGFLSQA